MQIWQAFILGISFLGKQMLQLMAARMRSAIFKGLNPLIVMAITALWAIKRTMGTKGVSIMSSLFTRLTATAGMLLGLVAAAGGAVAAEAARAVFVSGQVQVGSRTLVLNDAIQEGDEIATGKQGYVYLKTVDNGLLILRPDSRARIVTYHVDKVDPSKTQIKFELLSGVARSVSGDAVKLARQNFRFNTPVAAIGVRGTDFTVSTDQETSRVTVISGAIVVSGFTGTCSPGGSGPCEHNASRELSANQVGQMLQVKRGQAVPQLMASSPQAPDVVSPPRSDEPVGKSGGPTGGAADISLDPKKADNLLHQAELVKNTNAVPTPPVLAPNDGVTVIPSEPVVPVVPATPETDASKLVWGRWQAVLDQAPQNDNVALAKSGATLVGHNSYYSVFRAKGDTYQSPNEGSVAFVLKDSEAFVKNSATNTATAATLQNGTLAVDFGKSRFATAFDLLSDGVTNKLHAEGAVGSDGLLVGDTQFYQKVTNMNVSGALSKTGGGTAAYVFDSRLDAQRVVNGVTYWGK
jgi:hypothetical protein